MSDPSTYELTKAEEPAENGQFIAKIEIANSDSPLATAVKDAARNWIKQNDLGYALESIKTLPLHKLTDYLLNTATEGLGEDDAKNGYNDSTTSPTALVTPTTRTRDMYVESARAPASAQHTDTAPTEAPVGFEIAENQQPVMAIVALDPTQLGEIDDTERQSLTNEVRQLFEQAIGTGYDTVQMSEELRAILGRTLLANDTFISAHDNDGNAQRWPKPFDLIASLKALEVLFTNSSNSGALRQGALRVEKSNRTIIVGCSGLNSAIDEMVARNFADDIFEKLAVAPNEQQ